MKHHTDQDHFAAFRHLLESIQTMAGQIATTGAVGPLLAWDSIQETGVRRFRFATVIGQNDRLMVNEILTHLRQCAYSIPCSVVILRTQLVRPQPDLQIRGTVVGYSIASKDVWCSEALITTRPDHRPQWVAINDDRLHNLIEPAAAFVRFCHAQGVLYA